MPVVGSRHYQGPGLGEGMWHCPSCGAENQGPIASGCALCSAGSPDQAPSPPPPPEPEPPAAEDNVWTRWAAAHPDGTLEQAFTAGYVEGVRTGMAAAHQQRPAVPIFYTKDGIVNRTLIAALELFRDQVLVGVPEEVQSGEWLNAAEVNELIAQLARQVIHG